MIRAGWVFAFAGLALVACGKKQTSDDCQQFVDKSAPVLRDLAKAAGKTLEPAKLGEMLAQCRSGKSKGEDQGMFDCVIAAADQEAVATCWQGGFEAYRSAASGGAGSARSPSRGAAGEGELQLNRLAKNAKVYFLENAAFPEGSAGPTTECCGEPTHGCEPDPARWTGVWEQLAFSVDDTSHAQYSYEGTATGFVAKAMVDMDCDGEPAVVTATGTVDNGNPVVEITSSGSD